MDEDISSASFIIREELARKSARHVKRTEGYRTLSLN
jgi:hypothetical protein